MSAASTPFAPVLCAGTATVALAGCSGVQSALSPEGIESERTWVLFWVLTAGGSTILVTVVVLAVAAIIRRPAWLGTEALVVGGGLVFPVVSLTALLGYGLLLMNVSAGESAVKPALELEVKAEQWWWRIVYKMPDGTRVESANEIRIPVGQTIRLELTTADVIHSFWVPKLAGKLDMIPGRKNVLNLVANKAGVSRGQCAEYCGGAHAFMSFYVVALPTDDFAKWLANEAGGARNQNEQAAGQMLFLSHGCGSCHTIRGTAAVGTIGPDLTHVGNRMSLAAGALPNDEQAFARWIVNNQHVKPENRMPPFGIFTDAELQSLTQFLAALK
ncbi:c-type cytochrome [Pseudorhodoplanes sinuspersici]|uniref:Cytochrome C oxidase subunit II n=1 Tax=Pseudorhodoplanes sinuspersici TaxID=1235591 RepID=A0A1W6ZQW6_9HYPH|nr:c-type cytochrome [Pseudorhodoplanes sinuspersici]ARP99657.1 cytochrome C oxidase subunit II [Pseudorhodoplanes sinuspersici]RKE70636.1 cytochrome c oxidase subunit 2 [Pseudorhodoplanes sinuspersici]